MSKLFPTVPLSQIAAISMGQSPDSSTVNELGNAGLPFLQGNAEFGEKHPSPKYSCIRPPRIGETGATLISVRAPVGQTNIADRDYCIGRGLAAVKSNQYGPVLCRAIMAQQAGTLKKVSQGTTFEAIGRDDLFSLLIPQIPPKEAKFIESILDTLDTQIQKTEALIAKLEKIKEGLLHDLLTRGIDQNGQLRPTPEQAPVLYKESALGLIPEEWICSELQDLLDCPTRSGLYKPSTFHGRGAPMIQMGNIFSSELVSFEKVGRVSVTPSELKIFGLEDGDLLFARRSLVLEGAGKASLVKDLPEPSTFESSIVRLRLRRNVILPYFAIAFLQSSFSYSNRRKFIRQVAVSGVSSADIRQFRCLVPPLEEQQTIVSFLKASRLRVASERETLAKLKKQKAGLMDDLLTGYVRVTPLIKDAV